MCAFIPKSESFISTLDSVWGQIYNPLDAFTRQPYLNVQTPMFWNGKVDKK
jgi:hypothetical protein